MADHQHADFIAKIVKDPKNPPSTLMLTGYLGASSEEGHTRLYFDPQLSSYVEIPDDAILHSQAAGGDLGGSHVWIKRDAQLTYGPASTTRPKGTFLDGPIMQDNMGAAATPAGAGPAAPTMQCVSLGCLPTAFCPHVTHHPCHTIRDCNFPLRTVFICNTLIDPQCLQITPTTTIFTPTPISQACGGFGPGGGQEMQRAMPAAQGAPPQAGGAAGAHPSMPPICGGFTAPVVCHHTPLCPPTIQHACPSVVVLCPSQQVAHCTVPPTLLPPCPPPTVVSVHVGCPTLGLCPSIACLPGGGGINEQQKMPAPGGGQGGPQAGVTVFSVNPDQCNTMFGPHCVNGPRTEFVGALPTMWAYCSQVCHPSFLGMGCGTGGGTMQMAVQTMWHNCTQVCSAMWCPQGTHVCTM